MKDVTKTERTVLFVSHNMGAIQSLCTSSVLLRKGRVVAAGDTATTIAKYQSNTNNFGNHSGEADFSDDVADDSGFILYTMRTTDHKGLIRSSFLNFDPIFVEFEFSLTKRLPYLKIGFKVRNAAGQEIFTSFHNDKKEILGYVPDASHLYRIKACIPNCILNEGVYYITPLVGIHKKKWIVKDAKGLYINISFGVENVDYVGSKRSGAIAPLLEWYDT